MICYSQENVVFAAVTKVLFKFGGINVPMLLLQEAALRYDAKTPRYLHVASPKVNRWGHPRSYRLQVFTFAGDHLPESEPEERSMSWAR